MTQDEAIAVLATQLHRPVPEVAITRCTGDTETCPIDECMICGVRDCPDNEPLHYHHNGCPACESFHVTIGGDA